MAARGAAPQNDAGVAYNACGPVEPRQRHLLRDEAFGRYAVVGSNYVCAVDAPGLARHRYATGVAEQTYATELACRQTEPPPAEPATDRLHNAPVPVPSMTDGGAASAQLVAAVAVLRRDEWATLLQALPLGADRWRFIALDGQASDLTGLVVIGVNGADRSGEVDPHTAASRANLT